LKDLINAGMPIIKTAKATIQSVIDTPISTPSKGNINSIPTMVTKIAVNLSILPPFLFKLLNIERKWHLKGFCF